MTRFAAPAPGLAPIDIAAPPVPDCPRCGTALKPGRLHVPGHRVVVAADCPACGGAFLCDLPTSFGMLAPEIADRTGAGFAGEAVLPFWRAWFDRMLRDRRDDPVQIDAVLDPALHRPLFLHCLDPIFGHGLKRLLHAEAYLKRDPDRPLVPIVSPDLVPFLPDGIAGHVRVAWPAPVRPAWNTNLDAALHALLTRHAGAALCQTVPSLSAADIDITRHSRVTPFDRSDWTRRPLKVCAIWRDTRCWAGSPEAQADAFGRLAGALRERHNDLEFHVTGVAAQRPALPPSVIDSRRPIPCTPDDEAAMLRLYAGAHLVVGAHGSNMLLPSAHAGATIELVPPKRWHNAWTASLFRDPHDAAATAFFHRFLPMETRPETVADVAHAILAFAPRFGLLGASGATRFHRVDPDALARAGRRLRPFKP